MKSFLFFLALPITVLAQNFDYKNKQVEWPAPDSRMSVAKEFESEDVVILKDETTLYLGQRGSSISHSFTRHVRVRLQNEKGVKKFSQVVLPESFNHNSDYDDNRFYFPTNGTTHRPIYSDVTVNYFGARIYKENGSVELAKVKDSVEVLTLRRYDDVYKGFSYSFKLQNIIVGDEIELIYQYTLPTSVSVNNNYYFGSEFPIQDYRFTLKTGKDLYYVLIPINNSVVNDTTLVTDGNKDVRLYSWKYQNLKPVHYEGYHHHLQMPGFAVYYHMREIPDNAIAADPSLSNKKPYPWSYIITNRMLEYRDGKEEDVFSRTDKKTSGYNKYFKKWGDLAGDTSRILRFNSIHNSINKLKFKSNLEHYNEVNHFNTPPSDMFDKGIIKEMDIKPTYHNLLERFRQPYFMALIPDKRIDKIDPEVYHNVEGLLMTFMLPATNGYIYYVSRSKNGTYFPNELPFYLEGSKALAIPLNLHKEKPEEFKYYYPRFIDLPGSEASENSRSTFFVINCSVDSNKINADGRVTLTGQYSTLTRNFFLSGLKDKTVNSLYYQKVADLAGAVTRKEKVTVLSENFPFTTKVETGFSIDKVKFNELPLGELFMFVYSQDNDLANRSNPYHPDFKGRDTYKFQIKFDKPVEITNAAAFENNITNAFGSFVTSLKKLDPQTYLLEASFKVEKDVIQVNEIPDMKLIIDQIKNISGLKASVQPAM